MRDQLARPSRFRTIAKICVPPVLMVALAPLVSCSDERNIPIVKLREGEPSRIAETVYDGEYFLYSVDSHTPLKHYHLSAGQPIGFERKGLNVIAYAGNHRDTLPSGVYVWDRHGLLKPATSTSH